MIPISHVGFASTPLSLAQPWLATLESSFQSATVRLNWSDTNLHLHVELEDRQIYSASTGHSQTLHLMGDTLEVFLMLPDAPQYFELHVSPHNHRTLLRWPLGMIEKLRIREVNIEDFHENPDGFDSRVQSLESGWEVNIDIPAALLGIDNYSVGQQLLLSVSRYDYADLETPPVLSTLAAHQVMNFHRTQDWLNLELS